MTTAFSVKTSRAVALGTTPWGTFALGCTYQAGESREMQKSIRAIDTAIEIANTNALCNLQRLTVQRRRYLSEVKVTRVGCWRLKAREDQRRWFRRRAFVCSPGGRGRINHHGSGWLAETFDRMRRARGKAGLN